jgi:beta-mannosidase
VWTTDEGLGGIGVHVANDRNEQLRGQLRVALYREFELCVEEQIVPLELDPHGAFSDNLERLLGRFVDAAWTYRFGPPAQDLIVISLEQPGGAEPALLSQAFRLPAGRPTERESPARLGLRARLTGRRDGIATVTVSAQRFAYGVRIGVPGFRASDDAFSVEPGRERRVEMIAEPGTCEPARGMLTALNLAGHVAIEVGDL